MDADQKLALIGTIIDRQAAAQNEEPGSDPYQADAYLAMEAIAVILDGSPRFRENGAFRTYFADSAVS